MFVSFFYPLYDETDVVYVIKDFLPLVFNMWPQPFKELGTKGQSISK